MASGFQAVKERREALAALVACAVNPVAVGPRCILICCVAHVPNITRYSASSLLAYQAHRGPF